MNGLEAGAAGRVVVAGGGVAGLATALALSRAGHRVLVLERDDVPLAGDPEAAFAVERNGAPQAHQTHGFLARVVVTLRERFPDVLAALEACGSRVISLTRDLEGTEEGDDDLAVLIVRRTTFEWALRRAVLAEPGAEVRSDVAVTALTGIASTDGDPPRVTGVVLDSGEVVPAAAVVACTGRRGEIEPWLAPFGVAVPEEVHPTGHLYITRWYRFAGEVDLEAHTRLGGDLGWLKFLAVPGDGDTLSATLAVRTDDTELRTLLNDPDHFDTALRLLPGPGRLLDEVGGEPIGPVRPMAGLINRLRHFVTDDGAPTVLGFHAVGDSHTCTNPMYGRGCSLAVVQATLLADAFTAHPDDADERTRAYEAASAREVEPWFHSAVQLDAYKPSPGGGENPIARVMASGVNDPVVSRGIIRVFNLLTRPDQLFGEPEFMARVAAILADPAVQPVPVEGPTRAELLAAVA
jgi:2-polyprenyl-6-methoxyphenol hydroxylase-like FAD-dependent oxidoreductase